MKGSYPLRGLLLLVAAPHSIDTAMCQPSSSAVLPGSCRSALQAHLLSHPAHKGVITHSFSRIMLGCILCMQVPELLQ